MKSKTTETVPTDIVNTDQGQIRGLVEDGISVFRGIPYAAAPVGPLRWRAPAPGPTWPAPTVREMTLNGPSPLQNAAMCEAVGGGDPGEMNEDCLYLNVWSPSLTAAPKLPVLVWIYGGAYILGAGGLPMYDGRPYAHKGAVLVTFNYRLGCLGFFKHPKLEEEEKSAGRPHVNNFGLLDQIAALEWVNRNIERFGGDKNNVTIFGQSAGSRSVLALYATPLLRDRGEELPRLFHRGIAQSVYRNKEALASKALGRCTKLTRALGLVGEAATPAALRALDARRLLNLDGQLDSDQMKGTSNSPVAIVGDSVLPEGVFASFEAGEVLPLPLIIGNTSDDVSVVLDTELTAQNLIEFSGKYAKELVTYYPDLNQDEDELDREEIGRRVGRDGFFTEVTNRIAHAHALHGHPAWQYYYDYTAVNLRPDVTAGTRHGDDVIFSMNTLGIAAIYAPPPVSPPATDPIVFTPADHTFATKVSTYWFQFALHGTPSCPGSQPWPRTTAEHSNTLMLGNAEAADKGEITLKPEFMKTQMPALREIGVSYDGAVALQP